jgi:hypothetical protein
MNAPDKIYVSRNFSEDNSPHGLWYLNKSEHDINVEYIRKDALLEWAKEKKEKVNDDEGDFSFGYVSAMIGLIDKIESM